MMGQFVDGATVEGGAIRVRPDMPPGVMRGVIRRAGILELLLANPGGVSLSDIMCHIGASEGGTQGSLAALQDECLALEERRDGGRWYIQLDMDEWRASGWRAGYGDREDYELTVAGRAKQSSRPNTAERDAEIRRRYASGEGTAEIAASLGLTRARIWQIANRGGVSRRTRIAA